MRRPAHGRFFLGTYPSDVLGDERQHRRRAYGVRAAGRIGPLGLATLGISLAVGGCSLVLDFSRPVRPANSDAGIDAAPPPDAMPMIDSAPPPSDAAIATQCLSLEPNNTLPEAIAFPLGVGPLNGSICPKSDVDFYSFTLGTGLDLKLALAFDATQVDLNLRLYNSAGTVIAGAISGTASVERISQTLALSNQLQAGAYTIEVLSFQKNRAADYTLRLTMGVGL